MKKTSVLILKIEPELKERLEEAAKGEGISQGELTWRAIQYLIDILEMRSSKEDDWREMLGEAKHQENARR